MEAQRIDLFAFFHLCYVVKYGKMYHPEGCSNKGKLAKGSSLPCDKLLPGFSNETLISVTTVGFI